MPKRTAKSEKQKARKKMNRRETERIGERDEEEQKASETYSDEDNSEVDDAMLCSLGEDTSSEDSDDEQFQRLQSMTTTELRNRCKLKEVNTSGHKDVLIATLLHSNKYELNWDNKDISKPLPAFNHPSGPTHLIPNRSRDAQNFCLPRSTVS